MKRVFSLALACVLVLTLAPAAFAEWDLSGLTFDELVALKDQINLAIWSSAEWQEVTVPQGLWKVGEDIPVGTWTIKCNDGYFTKIIAGTNVKPSGDGLEFPYGAANMIYNPNHSMYRSDKITEWSVVLHDGDYVEVDDAPAVFTPYAGKPSLGFK